MGINKDSVFLGLPTYDAKIDANMAATAFRGSSQNRKLVVCPQGGSLLAYIFNSLYCTALNSREEHDLKWFAMLHGDIIPGPWWIDTLIEEAEAHDADVMSAVVPIKSPEGLTSTAIEDPGSPWEPSFRLTLKQVNDEKFPQTFDAHRARKACWLAHKIPSQPGSRLLVNTGCFVSRLDRPWSDQVRFTIQDRIYKDETGQYRCSVIPEDWQFSSDVAALGGKVFATTKVRVNHRGLADYNSNGTWGLERDHLCEKS